jgi:hypothetical protein
MEWFGVVFVRSRSAKIFLCIRGESFIYCYYGIENR